MDGNEYKKELRGLLERQGIASLRKYGRDLQMKNTTSFSKAVLIDQIVGILCGEIKPERGKIGAPAKDATREKRIAREVEDLQREFGLIEGNPTPSQAVSAPTASLSFTVALDSLTHLQKRLLIDMINSF